MKERNLVLINKNDGHKINTLDIGGVSYNVEFPYTFQEIGDAGGMIKYEEGELLLADEVLGSQRTLDNISISLWHEIIHGLSHASCNILFPDDNELEMKVNLLATQLYGFLKNNNLNPFTFVQG